MPGPFAAKQGDQIVGIDTHIIISAALGVPVPVPLPFNGTIDGSLSMNVMIEGRAAATVGSTGTNMPPHPPAGGSFSKPPTNQGTIITGSMTVYINGKQAARAGDTAMTCNDPVDLPVSTVVVPASTVFVG